MKTKNDNTKSMIAHVKRPLVLATCLILAALGPPAAELSRAGGSPPVPINQTFTTNACGSFDVQVTTTGKGNTFALPGGRFLIIGPNFYATFTNLSDPTKSVTLNLTGSEHVSFDANGNQVFMLPGRNGVFDPSIGILLLVGNFTVVFDSNGNLIQAPTGSGQITQVCDLIN